MSDKVKKEIGDKRKEFARNPVSKKADKVFGTVLNIRRAVNSAESGKSSKRSSRSFPINISEDARSTLGSLRSDLAATCTALGLANPLLDQFELTFDIEIETGSAIWLLVDANKFWELSQLEMLATCRDKVAATYLERIRKEGTELRGQLNQYAHLLQALQTPLPAEMQESLQADVEEFTKAAVRHAENMKRRMEFEAGEGMVALLKKQLKLEKDIFKYRAGKSAIVFIDTGLIAGHIAHMAASFGATAPLAIIACVRLVVEIGQIAEKSLRDLEAIGRRIDSYVDIVSKFWGTKKAESGTLEKLQANAMEAFSGFVAGVTNIDLPSVETIKTLMNDYQHKLNVLTKTYNDLGFELARLQRIMEAYTKILNDSSKRMTADQKKTLNSLIDHAEQTYGAMYQKALGDGGKNARMGKAAENIAGWLVSVDKLDAVTSKYMKYITKITKILTSAGLGLGNLGGELVTLTSEMAQQSAELAALVHEHAAEALISAMEDKLLESAVEIASTNLKMIGEAVVVIVADGGMANVMERLAEVRD